MRALLHPSTYSSSSPQPALNLLTNYRHLLSFSSLSSSTKPYDSIPSPPHTPNMGTIPDFQNRLKSHQGDFTKAAASYYREYGPLIRQHIVEPQTWVFHPDDMLEAFRQEGKYPTSQANELWNIIEYLKLRNLSSILQVGPEWVRLRAAVQKDIFSLKAAESYLPAFDEPTRLASELIPYAPSLDKFTPLVASDLFFKAMLGYNPRTVLLVDPKRKHEVRNEDINFIENSIEATSLSITLILHPENKINFQKNPTFIKFMEAMDKVNKQSFAYLDEVLPKLEASLRNPSQSNEVIPYIQRVLSREEIDRKEVCDLFTNFFFAGVDTTHHVLLWILFHLAQNPNIQELLHQELVKSIPEGCDSKTVVFQNEHQRLPYLNAIMRESHRITPPLPIFSMRRFDKPVIVRGFEIPANSLVQFFTGAIQNDEKYINDPEVFSPERWFPDQVKKREGTEQEILDHKLLSKPFGFGPRMCLGARVAEAEIRSFLFRLVLDWKFEFEPKNPNFQVSHYGMSKVVPFPKVRFDRR